MKTKLREFTDKGLTLFREELNLLKNNPQSDLSNDLITNPEITNIISESIELELKRFNSKFEIAKYLYETLEPIQLDKKYYNYRMWSWLSAFYFDSICPRDKSGNRLVKQEAKYLFLPGWHIYRHLLAGPVQIYASYKDSPPNILLYGSPDSHSDFMEQIGGRIEIASRRNVVKSADILYWDESRSAPKKGSTNRTKGGTLRRFIDIIYQFDITYDFGTLSEKEIINLLPLEFKRFKYSSRK